MKLTKEMLIDWIDRPPSNSDLDLINYIIELQNNRDKAIEYIDNYLEREYFDDDILETNTIYNRDLFKVKNILKGDSDE